MKRLLFLPLVLLMLASCDNSFTDTITVKQVQNSDDDEYAYRLTLSSNGPGEIAYYTNFKHQVGDTLMSVDEFIQMEVDGREALKLENSTLRKKLDSIETHMNSMQFQYDLMVKYYNENILKRDLMLGDEAPKENK